MYKDASSKTVKIPKGFQEFVNGEQYYKFLEALLEYCRELFRLENKQSVLEVEAKQRGLAVPQVLTSEKKKLHEKAKRLANMYAWIVFNKRSIPDDHAVKCTSRIMFKSKLESFKDADKDFYEALVAFSTLCLELAFEKQDQLKL
jgi:protein phosphatase 1 regulatory subunit 36